MVAFYICFNCRVMKCNGKGCQSPKDICIDTCTQMVNETNVYYDFCTKCRRRMSNEFRGQLRARELVPFNPPREGE